MLALAETTQSDEVNDNNHDIITDEHNIGAIVDGYDPRMADVDIEMEEVGDEVHNNISQMKNLILWLKTNIR